MERTLFATASKHQEKLISWGTFTNSQLAPQSQESEQARKIPFYPPREFPISIPFVIKDIQATPEYTIFLSEDGRLFFQGRTRFTDQVAELKLSPIPQQPDKYAPICEMKCFDGIKIVQFATVLEHFLALTDQGKVYTWGNNDNCQCGRIGGQGVHEVHLQEKAVQVAVGNAHSLILTESGHVYGFGVNDCYQLGVEDIMGSSSPVMLDCLVHKRIVKVVANGEFNAALSDDNELFTWGENSADQLARQDNSILAAATDMPYQVKEIVNIIAGIETLFILDSAGNLYGVGESSYGTLGTIAPAVSNFVHIPMPEKIVHASCKYRTLLAISETGRLYVIGSNYLLVNGISNDTKKHLDSATLVPLSELNRVVKAFATPFHSFVVLKADKKSPQSHWNAYTPLADCKVQFRW